MSKAKKSKRFTYPLQTVLKVREIRENQALDAFQKAEKAYHDAQQTLLDIEKKRDHAYQELRDCLSGKSPTTNVQEVVLRKHHLDGLEQDILKQQAVVEETRLAMEDARQKLVSAMIDRKIIDKDKEKTRESWKKIMDKHDGLFLDDIAIIGFEAKNRRQRDQNTDPTDLKKKEQP